MDSRGKVIEHLKEIAEYFRGCRNNASFASKAENHFWELQNAASEAAELLKAQEPRVMTRAEVEAWSGAHHYDDLLWVDAPKDAAGYNCGDAHIGWSLIMSSIGGVIEQKRPQDEYLELPIEKYGITWRCWTSRPTDEQRRATPWAE